MIAHWMSNSDTAFIIGLLGGLFIGFVVGFVLSLMGG